MTLMTVHQSMAAVMAEIESVGKNDRNTQQGFNFRGIDAVVNAVGPALRKHSLVMVPEAGDPIVDHYESRGGAQMTHVLLPVTFRFYGPAGDSITCRVIGEASDAGDKVMSKAHSVAWRVALLECFAIPTDEPDPDAESHERAPASRGPDSIDWAGLGWESKDEHDEMWDRCKSLTRVLTEEDQAKVRAWIAEQGESVPYPRDLLDGWADCLSAFYPPSPLSAGDGGAASVDPPVGSSESEEPAGVNTARGEASPAGVSRAGASTVTTGGTGSPDVPGLDSLMAGAA